MSSILTNHASMAALSVLRSIDRNLETSQARISSGYRIADASDNAAYWSIATTMRSDNKALAAVEDAMGLGAAVVDTAYTGMTSAIDIVSEFKAKLVAAREPGVDKTKINKELTELKSQLRSVVESASFNGQNWLVWNDFPDDDNKSIVGSFVRGPGGVSVGTFVYEIHLDYSGTETDYLIDNGGDGEFGILTSRNFAYSVGAALDYVIVKGASNSLVTVEMALTSTTTGTEVDDMIKTVDAMFQRMTDVASTLGSLNTRIVMQRDFVASLRDTIERGIGRLVDADMNEESMRLKAFETQKQLGIQALSIANSNAATVLSLFG